FKAACPAHDDKRPSLKVSLADDGRILLKCFAGCTAEAVLESVGLGWGSLFSDGSVARPSRQRGDRPPKLKTGTMALYDRVYREFLARLVLYDRHREALRRRGLPAEAIDRNGYRSLRTNPNAKAIAA